MWRKQEVLQSIKKKKVAGPGNKFRKWFKPTLSHEGGEVTICDSLIKKQIPDQAALQGIQSEHDYYNIIVQHLL